MIKCLLKRKLGRIKTIRCKKKGLCWTRVGLVRDAWTERISVCCYEYRCPKRQRKVVEEKIRGAPPSFSSFHTFFFSFFVSFSFLSSSSSPFSYVKTHEQETGIPVDQAEENVFGEKLFSFRLLVFSFLYFLPFRHAKKSPAKNVGWEKIFERKAEGRHFFGYDKKYFRSPFAPFLFH